MICKFPPLATHQNRQQAIWRKQMVMIPANFIPISGKFSTYPTPIKHATALTAAIAQNQEEISLKVGNLTIGTP